MQQHVLDSYNFQRDLVTRDHAAEVRRADRKHALRVLLVVLAGLAITAVGLLAIYLTLLR